jgi:hypothetical protein
MTIRAHHLAFFLISLGIGAFWYLGHTRPLEAVGETQSPAIPEPCRTCAGSGMATCSSCKGRPAPARRIDCPDCKGSGRHHLRLGGRPGGPCQQCNGTGKRTVPETVCSTCSGKGHVPCPSCNGTGVFRPARINAPPKSIVMRHSLWEKALLRLRIPANPNPRPQRDANGGYPIVEDYLALLAGRWTGHVREWGDFRLQDGAWRMTATVQFRNPSGEMRTKRIEFIVQNRVLAKSLTVQ